MSYLFPLLTAWGAFNLTLILALCLVAFFRRSEPPSWDEEWASS